MKEINSDAFLDIARFAKGLRINAVNMTHNGNSSHVGSVLDLNNLYIDGIVY